MTNRTPLRDQLIRAWHSVIANDYTQQRINSEHGLQVSFCTALLREFELNKVTGRLFVEPRLFIGSQEIRFPDIAICSNSEVIGVVELKYQPRAQPTYEKDLETLSLIAQHGKELHISNDRYLGPPVDEHPYRLADDAVLCWAGVYRDHPLDLSAHEARKSLESRFLQLDAVTDKDTPPDVFPPLPRR